MSCQTFLANVVEGDGVAKTAVICVFFVEAKTAASSASAPLFPEPTRTSIFSGVRFKKIRLSKAHRLPIERKAEA